MPRKTIRQRRKCSLREFCCEWNADLDAVLSGISLDYLTDEEYAEHLQAQTAAQT